MITKNHRRHRRIPYLVPMRISWEDQGEPCFATARCIDLSQDGIRMELNQQVPRGARLQIAAERLNLFGSATVRRSERYGAKYPLGLQFTQPMPTSKIAEIEGGPAPTAL
jgi:PilZ domain